MGEKHALFIGMDFFQDERLSKLLAPQHDVIAFQQALINSNIGAFNSAELLFNADIVAAQSALHKLFDSRSSDDLLLLYYTGHGLIDDEGVLYLSLYQSNARTPTIGSLEAEFVKKRMKASKAGAQVVILDCCHSGAFMEGGTRKNSMIQKAVTRKTFEVQGKGQYVVSACADTEFAFEEGVLRQGDPNARPRSIFTECLVSGLTSGDAAPANDRISIESLFNYAREQVLSKKMPMEPQKWVAKGSDEIFIARNPNQRISPDVALRSELLTGTKGERLYAVRKLELIIQENTNPHLVAEARRILEDGLIDPEWVEVERAIRKVLGREPATSLPPDGQELLTRKLDERAGHVEREDPKPDTGKPPVQTEYSKQQYLVPDKGLRESLVPKSGEPPKSYLHSILIRYGSKLLKGGTIVFVLSLTFLFWYKQNYPLPKPPVVISEFEQSATILKSASDVLYDLYDQLALAERNTNIRIIEKEPESAFNFKVDNAYYYSTLGDPPTTSQFRTAMGIIGNYAILMRSLVDGSANEVSRGHILAIAKDRSALSSQPQLSAAAVALTPIIDRLLLVRSQAETKRIALEGAPAVSDLVGALRDATPAIFKLLLADTARSSGINSPKLREYKVALSNYVVVLDRLQNYFNSLAEGYRNPSDPATLAALAQATRALQLDVDSLRKALAAAR